MEGLCLHSVTIDYNGHLARNCVHRTASMVPEPLHWHLGEGVVCQEEELWPTGVKWNMSGSLCSLHQSHYNPGFPPPVSNWKNACPVLLASVETEEQTVNPGGKADTGSVAREP